MAKEEKSNLMQKETLFARIALFGGIALMLGLPWLLTRNWGQISFLETGQIGDTIGGITAPISGLLGAYLVFLALKAQVEANKVIQGQIAIQRMIDEINFTRIFLKDIIIQTAKAIDQFEYETQVSYKIMEKQKGEEAFVSYMNDYSKGGWTKINLKVDSVVFTNAVKIFYLFDYFLIKLEDSNLETDDLEYYIFMFETEYYINISNGLHKLYDVLDVDETSKAFLHFKDFLRIDNKFKKFKALNLKF